MSTYLLLAMLVWAPLWTQKMHESPEEARARYVSIATDTAEVVLDPTEPAAFVNDPHKAKTALMIASIEFWESGYHLRVDEGAQNGDNGFAVSLLQIHAEQGGIMLNGDGWIYYNEAKRTKSPEWMSSHRVYREADLKGIANRKNAIRVALHIARQSLRNGAGLCQYSGELGPCPKAELRLKHAIHYFAAHPFTEPLATKE